MYQLPTNSHPISNHSFSASIFFLFPDSTTIFDATQIVTKNCNNNMFLNIEITQWKNLKFHSNVLSDLPPAAFPCNYLQTARVPCCPRYIYSKITQPRTLLPTLGSQVRGGSTSADLAVLIKVPFSHLGLRNKKGAKGNFPTSVAVLWKVWPPPHAGDKSFMVTKLPL